MALPGDPVLIESRYCTWRSENADIIISLGVLPEPPSNIGEPTGCGRTSFSCSYGGDAPGFLGRVGFITLGSCRQPTERTREQWKEQEGGEEGRRHGLAPSQVY